ncbi:hypothetical protein DYB32_009254 [Aphanomyces invadans]|uniref:Glycosyltransferase family 28 N-terminal domain-containing protein n=1 Tax=Aphanomyces invadans TaxID=157072 RepID=A0A3R7A3U8_9STRA|nr:hypothetical protein DYB32_009254 [Aphanomyces invadans]
MGLHDTPKNIVIVSVGTRGDVQPYCVVGAALAALGHNVTVACEKRLEALVTTEFKLPYRPIVGDMMGCFFDEGYQTKLRTAKVLGFYHLMHQWNERFDKRDIYASYVAALHGADIVIGGPISTAESYSVAEAIGATWIPLFLGHIHLPTSEFPQWMLQDFTGSWFGSINKWTHSVVWNQVWQQQRVTINEWRQHTLHLPPITSSFGLRDTVLTNDSIVMYQACSVLFAGPKRRVPLDFAAGKVVYTGFLYPSTPQPEPEPLRVFLRQSDTPVIYIGFGSMPALQPLALLQFAIDVCKLTSTRCVLAAGWSLLDECKVLAEAHADVVYVESGVPQIPCPKFMDQFHHAQVLVDLGVAPCSISKTKLTAKYVATVVQRVLRDDNSIQMTARAMGEFVAKESHDALPRLCERIVETKPTFLKSTP